MTELSESDVRMQRLESLVKHGVNPYPAETSRTHSIHDVLGAFDALHASHEKVTIAGRAMAIRQLGALSFIRVDDGTSVMQAVIRKDDIGEEHYKLFADHADVGDIFEFSGEAFVTKSGERSILAHRFAFLAKALKPLPEKWNGLQDVEKRYRQRELDLITNADVRKRFIVRSKLVASIRRFLDEHGFLEVETPMLQAIPGGANARPFITHHNALNTDLYLRIAPELYLKRLVVGGFDKVYEIGRCFRNEGIDYAHNPEFTMLEFYWAYANRESFLSFMEELMVTAITSATGSTMVTSSEGDAIDFDAPWQRKTFREAIIEACGIDIDEHRSPSSLESAVQAKHLSIDFSACVGMGECYDELWKKTARPAIVAPTWIFDYPVELKPLAKANPSDATKSSAVQLVVQGAEIINAYYHELNDPIDQRKRFEEQQALREQGSEEAQWMDADFLRALEHGMPPASGMGLGIDRLVAFITGAPNLKESILFPALRPVKDEE